MLKLTNELKSQKEDTHASVLVALHDNVVFDTQAKLLYVNHEMQVLTQKEEHLLSILIKNMNYFI